MNFFVPSADKKDKPRIKRIENMYCQACGEEIASNAKFCTKCGTKMLNQNNTSQDKNYKKSKANENYHASSAMQEKLYAEGKNPWIALILSLLIIGLGQFYNGDIKKGAIMLAVGVVGVMLNLGVSWFIVAIYSAIDAYLVASRKSTLWT